MSPTAPHPNAGEPSAVPARAVAIAVVGMLGAWIAAGSVGPLADPLRHVLTWLALGTAVVVDWPRSQRSLRDWLILAGGVLVGLGMTVPSDPAINVLGVAVVLAALVRSPHTVRDRVVLLAALAVAVLGIYRAACVSIPAVWLAANWLGSTLGSLAGSVTGQPVAIGATFGGVDFLVLMAAWYTGWLAWTGPPRLPRAITAAAAILLVHLAYLGLLALSGDMLAALPEVRPPAVPEPGIDHVGSFTFSAAAASLLPWGLPVLAAVLHGLVAVAMARWAAWLPIAEADPATKGNRQEDAGGRELAAEVLTGIGPFVLAALLPVVTVLSIAPTDLVDSKVVVYDPGDVDWDKPEHDSGVGGAYGMLPMLVENLGGAVAPSAELNADDLSAADVVVLLHPAEPLPDERLERLLAWVRDDGGSLLVVPDPQAFGGPPEGSLPAVLEATSIRIRNDVVVPATPRWDAAPDGLRHPVTTGLGGRGLGDRGLGDRQNRLGLFVGSSLSTRLPAEPMVATRYALGEPGSHAMRTGRTLYDAGEPLGDLVLAAEQPVGRGRIAVLGSNACLHNDLLPRAYPFVGRLLTELSRPASGPRARWRQFVGVSVALGLIALLVWRVNPMKIAVAAAVLAVAWVSCAIASDRVARVLPEEDASRPHPIAYIDASHLEAYSSDASDDLGLNGLERTLTRAGYLPLYLWGLTAERLDRAAMLVSIAPGRNFSPVEQETVATFVRKGGVLIAMAGAEHARATNGLVEQFDFHLPAAPVPPQVVAREPRPDGAFGSRYLVIDDYQVNMWHHAAWPVECVAGNKLVLARDADNAPTIVSCPVGNGAVIVIGDTHFASNQNLEWGPAGAAVDNLDFWRWMLSRVVGPQEWIPPNRAGDPPNEEAPEPPPEAESAPGGEPLPSDEMPEDEPGEEPPAGEDASPPDPPPGGGLPIDETPAAMPSPEEKP